MGIKETKIMATREEQQCGHRSPPAYRSTLQKAMRKNQKFGKEEKIEKGNPNEDPDEKERIKGAARHWRERLRCGTCISLAKLMASKKRKSTKRHSEMYNVQRPDQRYESAVHTIGIARE